MASGTQLSVQALQSAKLASIVAQVLERPQVDLLDWRMIWDSLH